jgi:hypothetical protein
MGKNARLLYRSIPPPDAALGDGDSAALSPDKTKQAVLACLKTVVGCSCGKWLISLSA